MLASKRRPRVSRMIDMERQGGVSVVGLAIGETRLHDW